MADNPARSASCPLRVRYQIMTAFNRTCSLFYVLRLDNSDDGCVAPKVGGVECEEVGDTVRLHYSYQACIIYLPTNGIVGIDQVSSKWYMAGLSGINSYCASMP